MPGTNVPRSSGRVVPGEVDADDRRVRGRPQSEPVEVGDDRLLQPGDLPGRCRCAASRRGRSAMPVTTAATAARTASGSPTTTSGRSRGRAAPAGAADARHQLGEQAQPDGGPGEDADDDRPPGDVGEREALDPGDRGDRRRRRRPASARPATGRPRARRTPATRAATNRARPDRDGPHRPPLGEQRPPVDAAPAAYAGNLPNSSATARSGVRERVDGSAGPSRR